ncbi:MAG: hypothetical protein V5A34_11765 [Halapricum sp.]
MSRISYRRGFGAGIAAFVVAYALSFGLVLTEIATSEGAFGLYTRPNGIDALLSVVGGTFYAAHLGIYEVPVGLGRTLDLYATVPAGVYTLIVIGALALAGFLTASGVSDDFVGALARGAIVGLGYASLLGLSALVLGVVSDSSPVVFIGQSLRLFFGGLVYSVVFAGGGGVIVVFRTKT